MKRKLLAAMILAVAVLAGCGEDEVQSPIVQTLEAEDIADETVETATETVEEQLGVITDREVVDGKMQSYLTGEWKDEAVVKRRNMAVMIPNNQAALPQYGLSKASIIYEAPVEGRITRLMGIFEDYDDLEYIGPVRSSRAYYVLEAIAYDSIYCNWGLAVPMVAPIINTDRIDNVSQAVDGIDVPASEAFDRISRPGYKTEYTGYMFIDGYNKAIERLGYEKEYREDRFVQAFAFAADGAKAEYADYPSASKVYPGGTSTNSGGYGNANPCFAYNEEDGLYYRSQYGAPQIDELNGEQLTVSNVVFKVSVGGVLEPVEKDYLEFAVEGSGRAFIFTNGKVIEGTWSRTSETEPNMYYDENGNEIVLNQGKTWVCNIWKDYEQYMSWE